MTTHVDQREAGGFEERLLAALAIIDQRRQPAISHVPAPVRTRALHLSAQRPRLRRAVSVVAVLAGLLALTTAAVAALYNPASFEPDGEAVAGDPYPVKGSGCQAGNSVVFTLDGRTDLGATTARDEGIFSAEPRIPAETTPGPHDLAASCTDDQGEPLVQHATLMVVTSVPLDPPGLSAESAVADGPAVVKGAGCREGRQVVFTLDDTIALGATSAHRGGVFSAKLRIPGETTLGVHDVTAVCTDSDGERLVQHADLVVVEPEPEPSFGGIDKR
jgi:hypothetical protein